MEKEESKGDVLLGREIQPDASRINSFQPGKKRWGVHATGEVSVSPRNIPVQETPDTQRGRRCPLRPSLSSLQHEEKT